MNTKFNTIAENYINGNLKDFRNALKKLSKIELLQFAVFCQIHYSESLTIFEIESQFNK